MNVGNYVAVMPKTFTLAPNKLRPIIWTRCDNCAHMECLTLEMGDFLVCSVKDTETSASGLCDLWADARLKVVR